MWSIYYPDTSRRFSPLLPSDRTNDRLCFTVNTSETSKPHTWFTWIRYSSTNDTYRTTRHTRKYIYNYLITIAKTDVHTHTNTNTHDLRVIAFSSLSSSSSSTTHIFRASIYIAFVYFVVLRSAFCCFVLTRGERRALNFAFSKLPQRHQQFETNSRNFDRKLYTNNPDMYGEGTSECRRFVALTKGDVVVKCNIVWKRVYKWWN